MGLVKKYLLFFQHYRFMRESMFTQENGDQPNAKNIGIVLTDGKSNSEEDTWKVMGFC